MSASYTICIYLIRLTTTNTGVSLNNHTKMIILLVDQKNSYRTLTECSNISTSTNNISIISFGCNLLNNIPRVHKYMVTDLNSAVKAVLDYYK